jgi:hypothetical protein
MTNGEWTSNLDVILSGGRLRPFVIRHSSFNPLKLANRFERNAFELDQ